MRLARAPASIRQRLASARTPRGNLQTRSATSSSSGPSSQNQVNEKAQQAFAAASKGADKALEGAKQLSQAAADRVGGLFGSYRDPLSYNLSVARELIKQVYIAELVPPKSFAEVQAAYATIWRNVTQRAYWRQVVQSGEWAKLGIYGLQAYGLFKIGEMVGRRSIVGYNLQ